MRPKRTTLAYAAGLALAVDFSLGINGLLYPHLQERCPGLQGPPCPIACVDPVPVVPGRPRRPRRRRHFHAHPRLEADALRHGDRGADPRRILVGADAPDPVSARRPALRLPGEAPGRQHSNCPFHVSTRSLPRCAYLYRLDSSLEDAGERLQRDYPAKYIRRLVHLSTFPSAEAIEQLHDDNVRYIVVHEERYLDPAEGTRTVEELVRLGGNRSERWTTGGIRRR